MDLQPYAPAGSLILLAALALLAFARVRVVMKRYGDRAVAGGAPVATAQPRKGTEAEPWWVAHLDDYARPAPAPQPEPTARPQPAQAMRSPAEAEPITPAAPAPPPAPPLAAPQPAPARAVPSTPSPPVPLPPQPAAPHYAMQAPVELWFGDARAAVKRGSKTEERFQRYAATLLQDVIRARSSQ